MLIGVNDLNQSVSLGTLLINTASLIQRIQKATPLSEIVLASSWHVGNTVNTFNVGITNANWYTQVVQALNTIAYNNNCTFIDLSSWFGDAALWTVASVTSTNAGANLTVASGGFPNVEVGMYVLDQSAGGGRSPLSTRVVVARLPALATPSP